jgi:hypothetical protein
MSDLYQAPLAPGMGANGNPLGGNYAPSANPYFTMANQFMPRNLHDVIRWSRYITIQSPVTTEVLRKLSTYPITEFVIDTSSDKLREKYREVFKSFRLKTTLHNIGFEYYSLGNVFLSVYFPVQRTLTCQHCQAKYNAKTSEFTKFKKYEFEGVCPACGKNGTFKVTDTKSTNVNDMNIIKWDPTHIVVNHNPITGESEYYYKIPNDIKRRVKEGDKLFVNSVQWSLIDAIRNNQDYKIDSESIYHLKNISAGHEINGIAVPPVISLFSLVYYQATLRKANESISNDFMAPLRVIYPSAQTGNSDPVVSISMKNFVANMTDAVIKQKRDKSHVVIAPVPIGYQAVSGEGRNLLVSQEIQQAEESILLSLGVSRELLSGTTNWTSSTVGLRLLENTMLTYTSQIEGFINWAMAKVARYLALEIAEISLSPFRLTDDDNLRNLLVGLTNTGNASMSTLYESLGMDYGEELKKQRDDAIAKAVNEMKTKMEVDRAVFVASKQASDQFDKDDGYKVALAKAQQMAAQVSSADPQAQVEFMNQLMLNDYPQYLLVSKLMEESAQAQQALDPEQQGQPGQDKPGQGGDGKDPKQQQQNDGEAK